MSELAQTAVHRDHSLPSWATAIVAMMPGMLLTWAISADAGDFHHLIGASLALLAAGMILLTQQRTRGVGIGLILGFAVCYYHAVVPSVAQIALQLF